MVCRNILATVAGWRTSQFWWTREHRISLWLGVWNYLWGWCRDWLFSKTIWRTVIDFVGPVGPNVLAFWWRLPGWSPNLCVWFLWFTSGATSVDLLAVSRVPYTHLLFQACPQWLSFPSSVQKMSSRRFNLYYSVTKLNMVNTEMCMKVQDEMWTE